MIPQQTSVLARCLGVVDLSESRNRHAAFLSYKHGTDERLAAVLQAAVQRMAVPWYRRSSTRIFLDRSDLSADPRLWSTLQDVLAESNFLIFLACPAAASSEWVGREIDWWRQSGLARSDCDSALRRRCVMGRQSNDFDSAASTAIPSGLEGFFPEQPFWL